MHPPALPEDRDYFRPTDEIFFNRPPCKCDYLGCGCEDELREEEEEETDENQN